jgi:predicted O-methyltransferase YrrM
LNFFSLLKRYLIYNLKKKTSIDQEDFNKKTLEELFHHYGSDKANIFLKTNKEGHGYSSFYLKHLNNLKDKKINILEIGSFSGASAAAFAKYFAKSNVFCFDINISNFEYISKKIHVYGLDANNETKVKKTLKKIFNTYNFNNFDLIIDDGSHNLLDILSNLNFFFKYLNKGGNYIIEDFKHPNYYEYNRRDINHIFVDQFLDNIKKKNISKSTIFDYNNQKYLMNEIDFIDVGKGNLTDSDICLIKKK